MTKLTEYRVIRAHEGDRYYAEGDTRTAAASDVRHLVPNVLKPIETAEAEKSDPDNSNKAEGASPANKAAHARKSK